MIGISAWTPQNYQWNKKKTHFELSLQGSYKNSAHEKIFFREYHFFFPKSSHQILVTSTKPAFIQSKDTLQAIYKIEQHFIMHTTDSKKPNISSLKNFHKRNLFYKITALLPFYTPSAVADNKDCKDCHDQTLVSELQDMSQICDVILNSPPCLNIPKDKKATCDHSSQLQHTDFKHSNIWDYVRGCATGVFNPAKRVLGVYMELYEITNK